MSSYIPINNSWPEEAMRGYLVFEINYLDRVLHSKLFEFGSIVTAISRARQLEDFINKTWGAK